MQQAVREAAAQGLPLLLAPGSYRAGGITLPFECTIVGAGVTTAIIAAGDQPVFSSEGQRAITLADFSIVGGGGGAASGGSGLIALTGCSDLTLRNLSLSGGPGDGLHLDGCAGLVENCTISGLAGTGIFANDSAGLRLTGNTISICGNGGIRVWRSEPGQDGTIIAHNRVATIASNGGGNGQNGNGINVFRADGVSILGNQISGCAFSAIRLNTTANTVVSNNSCLQSGEVAIFSEFAFSGSIIADNVVDGAAAGISMTNFDQGGRLAVCSGNLVRNIAPLSVVNPDTIPFGIVAQADAVVSGNVVEGVPGRGIGAGWGPYLRDVVISGNLVRDCEIGIGVSVVDGAGPVRIDGNMVSGALRAGLAGMAWQDIVTDDLVGQAYRFANVSLGDNSLV